MARALVRQGSRGLPACKSVRIQGSWLRPLDPRRSIDGENCRLGLFVLQNAAQSGALGSARSAIMRLGLRHPCLPGQTLATP